MELRNLHYFREISAIPRKSFHEEKIADYLEAFARTHGLWHTRDQLHNVVFKKPGSAGREQEAPLMLQAHTDMVCAKEPWSRHDFLRDPIEIREKDGWMMANGTTLGADDGAGVANILGCWMSRRSRIRRWSVCSRCRRKMGWAAPRGWTCPRCEADE